MPRRRRNRHQTDADLRWYYSREWEGDMGLRSGMAFQLDQIQLGAWSPSTACRDFAPSERQTEAASRFNDIRRRIQALTPRQRSVLGSAYSTRTDDRLGPVLLVTGSVRALHAALESPPSLLCWCDRLLRRHGRGEASIQERRAIDDARTSLRHAVQAYEVA